MRPTLILLLVAISGSAGAQTTLLTFWGASPSHRFGASACGIGDVNGDGVPDLAFGVLGVPAGELRIMSGFDGSILHVLPGLAPGDEFGEFIRPAGDLNTDGVPDLAVGSRFGLGGTGYVRLVSGATGQQILLIPAKPGDIQFRLRDAGKDFDGDGVPDICGVGSGGAPRVFSGATGMLLFTFPLFAYGTNANSLSTCLLPDVNGDGFAELVVGSPYAATTPGAPVGLVLLLHGPSGSLGWSVAGGPNSVLGVAVGDIGDVDGDGLHDVAASAANNALASFPPSTQVMSGTTGGTLGGGFGGALSIAALGDITGDGNDDFGLAYQFAPWAHATVVTAVSPPSVAFSLTAAPCAHIAAAGDIDQDGFGDLVVSDPLYDAFSDVGSFRVISLAPGPSASIVDLGGACAHGPAVPTLTVPPPIISNYLLIAITGASPGKLGAVVADAGPPVATPLGSGCVAHLALAHSSAWIVMPIATNGAGMAWATTQVPPIVSLAGVQVTVQAVLLGTSGPLGFDLTNGRACTLGF